MQKAKAALTESFFVAKCAAWIVWIKCLTQGKEQNVFSLEQLFHTMLQCLLGCGFPSPRYVPLKLHTSLNTAISFHMTRDSCKRCTYSTRILTASSRSSVYGFNISVEFTRVPADGLINSSSSSSSSNNQLDNHRSKYIGVWNTFSYCIVLTPPQRLMMQLQQFPFHFVGRIQYWCVGFRATHEDSLVRQVGLPLELTHLHMFLCILFLEKPDNGVPQSPAWSLQCVGNTHTHTHTHTHWVELKPSSLSRNVLISNQLYPIIHRHQSVPCYAPHNVRASCLRGF